MGPQLPRAAASSLISTPAWRIDWPCPAAAFLGAKQRGESRPSLLSVRSLVTVAPKCPSSPAAGPLVQIRTGPGPGLSAGPRLNCGRWHAPGSFEAPGPARPERLPRACSGGGGEWAEGWRRDTKAPRDGRRGWAQRRQPSVKGIVLAPQSRPRARLLGTEPLAPRCARASSCGTSAHRRARASLRRSPSPPLPASRWARASLRRSPHPRPALEERGQPGNLSSNYELSP